MTKVYIFFLLFFLSCSAHAVLQDSYVHVVYADGSCSHEPDEQTGDQGLGMRPRMDLKLRPHDIVERAPTPTEPEQPPDPEPEPPPEPEPTPTWTTNITFVNFTSAQRTKYEIAAEMVERVMNDPSESMENAVLSYSNPCFGAGFVNNTNSGNISMSRQAVWDRHWNGNESLQNTVDNQLDVEVELYYADNNVVGYTYSTSRRIWVNRKFFDTYKPSSVASNLFHEWSHKLSFTHSSSFHSCREHTVPYAVGYLMRNRCIPMNDEYGY